MEIQNYLVLGATGGVGSAVARQLRGQGHRVMLAGRNQERVDALAADLDSPGCVVDGHSVGGVESCASEAAKHFGGLHGIANCIGSMLLKPAHLISPQEWSDTMSLHLNSSFGAVRGAAATMRGEGGSVVLVSSTAARVGLANHEAIAAAKAGIIGLAQSAAATYCAKGIRFNCVAPGLVQTKLTEKIWSNERTAATSRAMHPLGRFGQPQEIAEAIVWLLSPQASWVTGQVLGIDGGVATVRPTLR